MIDAPLIANNLEVNNQQAEAQFREAPWDAKRLILKLQLAAQVVKNQQKGIDTSVIVHDLTDGKRVFSHNTSYEHYAASVSKLFVTSVLLDELRAGTIEPETILAWEPSDRRAGAGEFDTESASTQATVRSLLFDMLNRSGNTAVRVLVNKGLGGANAVNQKYAQNYPQLKVTRLQPVSETGFLLGYTTPAEADFIMQHLYSQQDFYAYIVKDALRTNIFSDYGPRSQVKDTDNIAVIDKMGQLNDPEGNNRHDIGVIENAKNGRKLRYVLMTTNYEQPVGAVTNYAVESLKYFGKDMLRYTGDRALRLSEQSSEQRISHIQPAPSDARMTY